MRNSLACLVLLCPLAFAQLTEEQKLADFRQLASLYAKHYAPYEWKRDVARFDLYDISPWLARVAATRTDLEFYEACVEYVAKLNDGHDLFEVPSDFAASLGFSLDLFDNRPMVYAINRRDLPASSYPIAIGDELISIDGVGADDLIRSMANYAVAANNRTTARFAAATLTYRLQSQVPHAIDLPEESTVVFRSPDGEMKTLIIPWIRTGTPLRNAGPIPSPKAAEERSSAAAAPGYLQAGDPSYMLPLRMLANMKARQRPDGMVSGYGSLFPVHRMPENFTQRLGRSARDHFFSGTFVAGERRIGFLRIPHFSPSSYSLALMQWLTEIQYMQANVDGLIVDITRNPGGNACYTEELLSYLIPVPFRGASVEIRATSFFVMTFSRALEEAKALGAPDSLIEQYSRILEEVRTANGEPRGKTGVLALCGSPEVQPAVDRQGRGLSYNKPLMLLTDDLSASAADLFAAIIQDTWRGPIFGWRTMGLGGSVGYFENATTYSEGFASVTWTQLTREHPAAKPGYPTTAYIENVGVHPDIEYDSQTRENLLNRYGPYVDAFTNAMLNHIAVSQ